MLSSIIITAFIGLCLAVYALWIEQKIKNNPTYKPTCDISDKISCSKPFKSPYGKTFGIQNSITGIAYYLIIITLALLKLHTLLLITTLVGSIATLRLAYILYTKIKSFCLICSAIYVINIVLTMLVYKAFI